ncbi:hypothetical protein [Krasilnikovia sp. M28-CT-15]|uniref:hypothetical protein n=1 Tax=Krasilnikovia sp. M28-CT-15 TaxID=3373540 RepID=UPI003877266A
MTAPARQERRYRRLLWAYPRPYRRRHGVEILTTLLDMAEYGHGGPTVAQTLHLVACGIRQRFRLPFRRPFAMLAAVLAAIALGALASTGGTWLGWQTGTPVPSDDQMRALTGAMLGGKQTRVELFPWETGMRGPAVGVVANVVTTYSADRVRAALTAAGWRLVVFTEQPGGLVVDWVGNDPVVVPGKWLFITATKDGLTLDGYSSYTIGGANYGVDGATDARIDVWQLENAAVRPLTVAGLLVGAIAGWLMVAALSARLRHAGRAQRATVAALSVTAVLAAVVPTYYLYCHQYQVLVYDHPNPVPYDMYAFSEQLPAHLVPAGAAIGLVALAAAALITARGTRAASD